MSEFKICDVLGYVLEDDNTSFGGTAFEGETVEDFIETTLLSKNNSVEELNEQLVACGIIPIEIIPAQFLNNAIRYIQNYCDLSDVELFLDVYDVFEEELD